MGSMLIKKGLTQGECPELWNKYQPEDVKSIHKAYYEAGSDVVQTNTFGGNRSKLEIYNLMDQVYDLNFKAAKLATEVCPEGRFVAGDIGPTGKFLQPTGTYTFEQFKEIFAEQAKALTDGGVHLISIETMYDIEEAKAAIAGVQSVSSLPIVAEMSFNATPRGFFTLMGNDIETCMDSLIEAGADMVGTNCNLGSNEIIDLVKQIREHIENHPLIAQPNAGQPILMNGETVYPTGPDEYVKDIILMLEDTSLNAIGGCCGTNPAFIKKIHNFIKNRGNRS